MMVSKDKQLDVVRLEYRYSLTMSVVDGEEDMQYTTYGICAANQDGAIVVSYPDVSTDRELMQRLVGQCNNGRLDALHLQDILIDAVG